MAGSNTALQRERLDRSGGLKGRKPVGILKEWKGESKVSRTQHQRGVFQKRESVEDLGGREGGGRRQSKGIFPRSKRVHGSRAVEQPSHVQVPRFLLFAPSHCS